MLGDLFAIIAPVFICAGIGFIWARQERPFDVDLVTALMTNIGTPCLVFFTLTSAKLDLNAFGSMAVYAVLAIACSAVIGGAILKMSKLDIRSFLPPMMFSNCGNMGLPLCLLAFGEAGLVLAIVFFTVSAIGQFTLGMMIPSGTLSFKALVRIPILYAVFIAVVFIVLKIDPPAVIANTTEILGGMTIPMMLITLGVSLARLRFNALARATGLSLLRLILGFGVGVGLSVVLGLEGVERGILILQSSMPVAVFNYLFAQRYNRSPEEVAGLVFISTALSFASLPVLLWFVL
ncbi:MAG: AEC family transporter [Rhodospirillaceae bacterium]|jgi:malate permease and related proteins|nr:AEC family transporter [Rhodospirillaceae bacterium]MBT5245474.1 AEC family transporter [Rhodospirillaceae bacterium]MBT5560956.1 AEC family transporter [Rhodospirillaceae bacterium]MBT6240592.1 AEC family transporter [Rhodospirillaceae bacterium]MBT7137943.1 AEC family transporter [Rhodospirillaceae bacterium]